MVHISKTGLSKRPLPSSLHRSANPVKDRKKCAVVISVVIIVSFASVLCLKLHFSENVQQEEKVWKVKKTTSIRKGKQFELSPVLPLSEEIFPIMHDKQLQSSMVENMESLSDSAILKLLDLKINLIALDFDLTVIDIHTGGWWMDSVEELALRIRPTMHCFIHNALDRGLHIAIVTFSMQEGLIQDVLAYHFPDYASDIPVVGGGLINHNKKEHMVTAKERIENNNPRARGTISKSTTLLIDDDERNVQHAIKDGTYAILLDPDEPQRLFSDVQRLRLRSRKWWRVLLFGALVLCARSTTRVVRGDVANRNDFITRKLKDYLLDSNHVEKTVGILSDKIKNKASSESAVASALPV